MNTRHFIVFAALVLQANVVTAQSGGGAPPQVFTDEFSTAIDSLNYAKKNISMTDKDGNVTRKSLQDLDDEMSKALRFYKTKNFELAFPIVVELSQWGIKDAQTILGEMYIQGEGVEKSFERGLAWLGVAREGKGRKSAKKKFKHIYTQLDDKQKKYIDYLVGEYIDRYGMKEQNIKCKRQRKKGSHISETRCIKTPGSKSILYPIG